MVLKVHGVLLSNNVLRVIAALNEKGLDYELVVVDLRNGEHKKPEFLALNPFGQVPVLEDGDLKLFDSRAINRYIATKYKETGPDLLLSSSPVNSSSVEVWLQVESQQFDKPISSIAFNLFYKPMFGMTVDMAAVDADVTKLEKVLDIYEARLSKNKYLAGDEFSLVDLNHMPNLYILMKTEKKGLVTSRERVKAWWDDVSGRPAWQKTVALIPQ